MSMTSRRSKRGNAKAAAAPVTREPWDAELHRKVFRLASKDWTPPASVSVRHGVRSWTLTAVFTMPDGAGVTLTTRLEKRAEGVFRGDEGMKFAFTVRGRK